VLGYVTLPLGQMREKSAPSKVQFVTAICTLVAVINVLIEFKNSEFVIVELSATFCPDIDRETLFPKKIHLLTVIFTAVLVGLEINTEVPDDPLEIKAHFVNFKFVQVVKLRPLLPNLNCMF
jgi:hypothetical protein